MTSPGFSATISVDQTPQAAFDAITNVRGWWSENIEGRTDKLGAEFMYRYEEVHFCKLKITELVPGKKVVRQVLDSRFNFTPKTRASGRTRMSSLKSRRGVTKPKSDSRTGA